MQEPRPPAIPCRRIVIRRVLYFGLVIVTTLAMLGLLASVFQRNGLTPLEALLMFLYTLLILWITTSFWIAALGFWVHLTGGDPQSITRIPPTVRPGDGDVGGEFRTAIIMPVYNEDPDRVFSGLRAIWQSLKETGQDAGFDLFVLSDTRDPQLWMQEELSWYEMCRDLDAHGRVFYRNREKNTSRKCGNLSEFFQRWGGRYRYTIVLDADSVMGGATLVRMVEMMEAHPGVGLIQTPPLPVNHESLFARVLQFSSSLYGGMFTAGLNFWQLRDGNYWGHNAIIRTKAFTDHCHLPRLPGEEPFGGEILSHDFVESALLRKAGWEVWLAHDLGESYEELPTTLIDYAKRDRRWCQGNLQHLRVLFVKGLRGISRLHLIMGVMSYLSSPLWLLFLMVTGVEAYLQTQAVPVYFFGDNWIPVWPESYTVEMTTVLLVTLAMLFLPKTLGVILLMLHWPRMAGYGGFIRMNASVFLETVFTMLIAPVLMLYQSKFVMAILMKKSVGWPPQQRGDHRLSLEDAFAAHWGHTLVGLVAGVLSYLYVPDFFLWLTPVLAGLILAMPVSMISSSSDVGRMLSAWGIFRTPEESARPRVLCLLDESLERAQKMAVRAKGTPQQVLADPAVYALHQALLPHRPTQKRRRHQLRALTYQLLEEGSESLTWQEKRAMIAEEETLQRLHVLAAGRQSGAAPSA